MKFKDCPDETLLKFYYLSAPTNAQLAERLRLLGYTDATEHKVRRRKRELRHQGLLEARLVSTERERADIPSEDDLQ